MTEFMQLWCVTIADAESPGEERVVTVYAATKTEAGVRARNVYARDRGVSYDPERHKVLAVQLIATTEV